MNGKLLQFTGLECRSGVSNDNYYVNKYTDSTNLHTAIFSYRTLVQAVLFQKHFKNTELFFLTLRLLKHILYKR